MDLNQLLGDKTFSSMQGTLGETLPNILAAIAIFVIGWIVAVVVRMALKKGLGAIGINRRMGNSPDSLNIETIVAKLGYWLVLLMTLIAVFNTLNLSQVSQPLNSLVNQVFAYMPKLLSGGILTLLAWLLATLAKTAVGKGLSATSLDDRLVSEAGMAPISHNIGNILFWLIILLFLPAILGAFQLEGMLAPVQEMVDKILNMLPNIFAAGVIGFVGWLLAKILRDLSSNLLAAAGTDRMGLKMGLNSSMSLSKLIGSLIFVFIFLPSLIAALNALQIDAISRPATEMLGIMMAAIPDILAAAAILTITYFVAKFATGFIQPILEGVGVNALPQKMGLKNLAKEVSISELVSKAIMFFAMLFASVEAASKLGFSQVSHVVTTFIEFGGQVLLGSVILMVGFWLANLAYTTIKNITGTTGTANAARFGIMGLVTAMGLRSMGIADDIVNLAFGLTLGALAVAFALAFGLGGREAAGKQLEHWFSQMRR